MGILDNLKSLTANSTQKIGGVAGLSKKTGRPGSWDNTPKTDEEKRMVGILQSMLDDGDDAVKPWEAQRKKGFEYAIGHQYPGRRRRHKANPKFNYLWRNAEAMTSRLTNNNPTINLRSTEPVAQDNVTGMEKLIDSWWDELNMRMKLIEGTRGAMWLGDSFYYTYWDHDANRPCTEIVSAKCIRVNREATTIDDCTWLCHIQTMPIWKVYQYWPKSKGKIAPGQQTVDRPVDEMEGIAPADPTDDNPVVFDVHDSTTTYRVYSQQDYFGDNGEDTDMVQVAIFWIRDPARVSKKGYWKDGLPIMLFEDGETLIDSPKYPGGRNIVMCGNRIIHDEPNPFQHGEFPYVQQKAYGVPDEFWSLSFVYNMISPQKELNKTLAQIVENKNLIMQPRVMSERGSGFDPKLDTSKPGQHWLVNPGFLEKVKWIEPPSMPSDVAEILSFSVNAMKEISGINDASTGIKPPGVQSGTALQTLSLQSQSQSGVLEANTEDAIRRIGKQQVGLARQFVTEARMVQIKNADGTAQWIEIPVEAIQREWGVQVGVGSTLPVDRNILFQQAVEALQIGLFDQEEALRWMKHPGADSMLKRIDEQKKVRAAQEAQMAKLNGQIQGAAQGGPPDQGAQPQQAEPMQEQPQEGAAGGASGYLQ